MWTASAGDRAFTWFLFFGNRGISEIIAEKIHEYRVHRPQEAIANRGKPPGHGTLHPEMVTLRPTLKSALRHGWLDRDLSYEWGISRQKIEFPPPKKPFEGEGKILLILKLQSDGQ